MLVRKDSPQMKPSDQARITPSKFPSLPDLTPKHDERLMALLKGAFSGDVPVYFAAVPLALCVPFDLDYRPDLHPVVRKAISQMTEEWSNRNPFPHV
jgi:hypothetical protein